METQGPQMPAPAYVTSESEQESVVLVPAVTEQARSTSEPQMVQAEAHPPRLGPLNAQFSCIANESSSQTVDSQPTPIRPTTVLPIDALALAVPLEQLQEHPEWVDCPHCGKRGKSRVEQHNSWVTYLLGAVCCLGGICLAALPCLCHWCQNIHHYCALCGHELACIPNTGSKKIFPLVESIQPEVIASPAPVGEKVSRKDGQKPVKVKPAKKVPFA